MGVPLSVHMRGKMERERVEKEYTLSCAAYMCTHAPYVPHWQTQRQISATHCNTLQHIATHCNKPSACYLHAQQQMPATQYNTLQHTSTPCNSIQHSSHVILIFATANSCNTVQPQSHASATANSNNTPQHTATHCNIPQHTATHQTHLIDMHQQ